MKILILSGILLFNSALACSQKGQALRTMLEPVVGDAYQGCLKDPEYETVFTAYLDHMPDTQQLMEIVAESFYMEPRYVSVILGQGEQSRLRVWNKADKEDGTALSELHPESPNDMDYMLYGVFQGDEIIIQIESMQTEIGFRNVLIMTVR